MLQKWLRAVLAGILMTTLCALSADAALLDRAAYADAAKSVRIAFTAIQGKTTPLSASEIEERLGMASGSLTGLTITRLPTASEGTLLVDGKEVRAYEPLTRAQADTLVFLPSESKTAEFAFLPAAKSGGQETIATMTVLDKQNAAPIVESAMLTTTEGITVSSGIRAHDPDEDTVSVIVLERPQKGSVAFEGLYYTYTPFPGERGEDSFVFVCEDKYGNRSTEGMVNLNIERSAVTSYADMNGNPSHYAAIKLREQGIFTGETIAGRAFFRPEDTFSRGELLLLLLAATGRTDSVTPTVHTGLHNDGEIPLWLKPYVALGMREGLLLEDVFAWQEIPVRAEAVILVRRAAGMSYVKEFTPSLSDLAAIPEWAMRSYATLDAYRMLDLYDARRAKPMEALTRAYAADLAWQLAKYHDSEAVK